MRTGSTWSALGLDGRRLPARRVRGHDHVTNAALLELPCDVLAALEDQLTADNAPRIAARMVAEERTAPRRWRRTRSSPSASRCCRTSSRTPEVTVSYFEWVLGHRSFFWDRDEIRSRLAEKMATAFDRVWELSEERR